MLIVMILVYGSGVIYMCREGVQFMFECVAGLRGMAISKNESATAGGCILADDMGYAELTFSMIFLYGRH